jgi:hypothetical protein
MNRKRSHLAEQYRSKNSHRGHKNEKQLFMLFLLTVGIAVMVVSCRPTSTSEGISSSQAQIIDSGLWGNGGDNILSMYKNFRVSTGNYLNSLMERETMIAFCQETGSWTKTMGNYLVAFIAERGSDESVAYAESVENFAARLQTLNDEMLSEIQNSEELPDKKEWNQKFLDLDEVVDTMRNARVDFISAKYNSGTPLTEEQRTILIEQMDQGIAATRG